MSADNSIFSFTQQEKFTHIITTDNIYFQEIGLGSFTTGILYEYFNTRGNDGEYINRGVIRKSEDEEVTTIADIFGAPPKGADKMWGSWKGWKPVEDQPAGVYKDQSYRNWALVTKDNGIRRHLDFDLDYFAPASGLVDGQIPNIAVVGEDSVSRQYTPMAFHPTSQNGVSNDTLGLITSTFRYAEDTSFLTETDCPIVNLIVMNEFMIDLQKTIGPSEWDEFDGDGEETLGDSELDSILPMLDEIKISKYRTVAFSGELTFDLALAGDTVNCPVTEWVEFELRLYDKPMTNLSRPVAVPKSNFVADVKTDAFGRQMSNKEDGEITLPDGTKALAGWNLSYNEYLDKWETGTKQVLGKCMQDIPTANSPTVDVLIASDIAELLGQEGLTNKFVPGTGFCMPIFMQNGNPGQWTPNYSRTKDCRDEDLVKHKVRGFNFSQNRSYKKDDMVNLNQIDGIWHVSPLDKSEEDATVGVAKEWTFQYFLATKDQYFRGKNDADQLVSVTPFDAERIAHKGYYLGDTKQDGIVYNDQFSSLGYADVAGFKKSDSCWQVSSFDFMDSKIFGTRPDGNAIGTTQATIDAAGRDIPLLNENTLYRNAAHSGPFFGCVFPEGYEGSAITEVIDTDARDWDFKVEYSGTASFFLTPFVIQEEDKSGNPFFDEYEEPDVTINRYPEGDTEVIATRHDLVSATKADFYNQEKLTDRENAWYWPWFRDFTSTNNTPGFPPGTTFATAYYGPDMFYEYNKVGITDFKQLPADIATLGDPTSTWGQPWYSVQRSKLLYKHENDPTNYEANRGDLGVKKQIAKAFQSAAWISKTDQDPDGDKYDIDAAFGFEPKNKNKLQFRPLKMETYLAYNQWHDEVLADGDSDAVDYGNGPVSHDPFGEAYFLPVMDNDRQSKWIDTFTNPEDGNEQAPDARSLGDLPYKSWRNHMCRFFRSRGPMVDMDYMLLRETTNNFGSLTEMYRTDAQAPQGDLGTNIPAGQLKIGSVDVDKASDQRNRMFFNVRGEPTSYWEFGSDDYIGVQGWQELFLWKGESQDSVVDPAVKGVITAQCTIGARTTFQFKTENFFGMSSARNPNGDDFREDPSWGGEDGYKGDNTYCLSVTIYQQHPRGQTIFDSEYFCVHHFNPLPHLEGRSTQYHSGGYYQTYDEPENEDGTEWPFFETQEYDVTDGVDTFTGEIKVYTSTGGVELRVPTIIIEGAPYVLEQNAVIYSETSAGGYPLLPESQWGLNVTRVGKMLPYRYKTTVISIDDSFVTEANSRTLDVSSFSQLPTDDSEVPATDFAGKIILIDRGQDYVEGDIIGSLTYQDLKFEVTEVEEVDGLPGAIKGLKYIGPISQANADNPFIDDDIGDFPAIDPTIFPKEIDVLDKDSFLGLKFETITSENGRDFAAFMINGMVQTTYGIDQKPLYITRESQISSLSNKTSSGDEEYGFIAEELDTIFTVADDLKSSNNEYDLFFHAQNDPSFVWNSSGGGEDGGSFFSPGFATQIYYYGNDLNTAEVGEQFINLNIFTS